jgi:hypothetical protein
VALFLSALLAEAECGALESLSGAVFFTLVSELHAVKAGESTTRKSVTKKGRR